ncbi:acetylxylan esterase [Microbacterium sp. 4R-513]|uniref:acetylxylan esterase n=1 Tax=Microbacterium sp. 4R-513 TaxID=2567934 RepID=UPI0013E1603A|nr:acetylxylan esterase [Microbacterium sp. 4R-513]QIG40960.1 acetylxylan esterase [Microbacterium sp. 4R-513]
MPRFDLPLDELRRYRPEVSEPADFDDFWERTLGEARAEQRATTVAPAEPLLTTVEVRDVRFPGYAGEPIAAWLVLPRESSSPRGAVVQYVGYGGGRGHAHEHLAWASAGYAHLVMDTRGQGSGWSIGQTADPAGSGPAAPGMMTRGIESPETYYYRRLITDAVRAVDALRGLDLVDPDRVAVTGGSQGGGLALAVAGILPDVWALAADVPFLCHFERAVGMTDAYPYREIGDYLRVHRGDVDRAFSTLAYFDGVNFARRAVAPALFSAALEDTICPPSTVFAAANHYSGPSEVDVYPFNAHEGGGPERWRRQAEWLSSISPRVED